MAWETRGGRQYYYRSVRQGGKVRKVYFGRGPDAEAAAREDAEAKKRKEARRRELVEFRDSMREFDAIDGMLKHALNLLVEAELYTEGYYERDREWRKRGGSPRDERPGSKDVGEHVAD